MFFAAKFNNFCNKIVDWFVINFKKQQTKRIVRQWRRRRSSVYPQNNMLKRNSVDNGTKEKKVKTYNIEFGIFEQMGIEFIYGSNKSRKLRWFFIVLAMLFLVLFQCIDAVNRYLEWKVNTQITSETYQKIGYPSVLFCNVNPVKKSAIGSNLIIHLFIVLTNTLDLAVNAFETAIKVNSDVV